MICALCQKGNPDSAAFCISCGAPLGAVCGQCGGELAPEAKFCHRCGHAVAAPQLPTHPALLRAVPASVGLEQPKPPELPATPDAAQTSHSTEGERRILTVLFCDVQGSTAMAERLDPEEWADIMNGAFEHLIGSVYHYEGTVARLMGDAILAIFGAPVAHEDDPQRAVLAGLAILRGIQSYSERMKQERGAEINVRVGINTGLVVVGEMGTHQHLEYTVMGDAVNLASRMEQTAAPGTVQISGNTHKLVKTLFEFETLGDIHVKGKEQTVPAYRVLGLLETPRSARGLELYGLSVPLVGRDDELQTMLDIFGHVLGGRTSVVSIIGEAGAGKSRLLREFLSYLEAEGRLDDCRVWLWSANCSSLGEQPYGVFAGFFASAYGVSRGDSPEATERKLREALQALGAGQADVKRWLPLFYHLVGIDQGRIGLPAVEPEQLKRHLFLAVRSVLKLHLDQRPLVLLVEDVHWADAASIDLLRFLTDQLEGSPFLVLLAHRPSLDVGSFATGRTAYTPVRLGPLPAAEINDLLDGYFGPLSDRIPVRVRQLVVERADGNPFYAEEIVRSFIEAGTLKLEPDGWVWTADVADFDVPATVQGLLLARLDHLPTTTLRFAQEAAVLGPAFDGEVLRAVCSDPGSMDVYLDQLFRAELVEPVPPRWNSETGLRYRFTNLLVQEVAYQSVLLRRRMEMHGHIAASLEEMCGGQPDRLEDLELLGHHYSLSANKVKGAVYLIAAGNRACNLYANEDAARYYRRALETLRTCDQPDCWVERLAAREGLADVLGLLGRREESLAQYEDALAGYGEDGDKPSRARLRRKIASLHWEAGAREAALVQYQTALELLNGQTEHIEVAHLSQEMGRLAFRSGDNQEAIQWAQKALDTAEQLVTRNGISQEAASATAHAYNTIGVALARAARLEEAVEYVERSIEVAQKYDLPQAACRAYTNLGVLYTNLDPGQAIEICSAGLDLAKKIGDMSMQSWLYANLASAYCTFTGQCEAEGIAAAEAAIELDRQFGQLDHLAVPLIVLGQIYQCHGDPEAALASYQEALRLAQEMREPQLLFPCYDGLATLYLEAGDMARAEGYMAKSEQVCEEAGLEVDSLVMMPFLY